MWPDLQAFFACALLLACVLHVDCIGRGLTCTLEDPHRSGVWHTDPISKTGFRCCRNITCQKGEQPKVEPCTNDTFDTRCEPCSVGEYQDKALESQHGYMCKEFACNDDSLRLTNPDDRIYRDRAPICECDWEMGNYDRGEGFDYCGVKDCGAGLQMDKSGNCNPCKNGYFKAEANRLQCIGVSDYCWLLNMTAPKHHNNTHANCLGGVRGNGGVSILNSSRTTTSSTTVLSSTEPEALTTLYPPFSPPQLGHLNWRVTLIVVIVIILLVLVFFMLLLAIIKNWACITKNLMPKLWRRDKSDRNANATENGTASLSVEPLGGEENRTELAVEHEDEVITLLNHQQTVDKPCGETARLLSTAPALTVTQPPHPNPLPPRSAAGPSEGSDHDSDESHDSVSRDLPDSDAIKPKNDYQRNISHDSGIDVKSLQLETIVSIDQERKLQSFPSPRDSPPSPRESPPSSRDSPPEYTSVDLNLAQVHTTATGNTQHTQDAGCQVLNRCVIINVSGDGSKVGDISVGVNYHSGSSGNSSPQIHTADVALPRCASGPSTSGVVIDVDGDEGCHGDVDEDATQVKRYFPAKESGKSGSDQQVVNPGLGCNAFGVKSHES